MSTKLALVAIITALVAIVAAQVHPTPVVRAAEILNPDIQKYIGRAFIFQVEVGYVTTYHQLGDIMYAMYGSYTNSGADSARYVVRVDPATPVTGHPDIELCELAYRGEFCLPENGPFKPAPAKQFFGRSVSIRDGKVLSATDLDETAHYKGYEDDAGWVNMICRPEGWHGHPVVDWGPGQRELKNQAVAWVQAASDQGWVLKKARRTVNTLLTPWSSWTNGEPLVVAAQKGLSDPELYEHRVDRGVWVHRVKVDPE